VVETKTSHGLAVPAAAVLYGSEGATVQVVDGGVVRTRKVKLGLEQNGMIEVSEGLNAGEIVVARSGTFLRDGDAVRAVLRQGPQPQQLGSAG
jgi:multidrug efflux pump subunit AcrA (membrane-fusion protein)